MTKMISIEQSIDKSILIGEICNLIKKYPHEIRRSAVWAIVDTVIVSQSKDNDSMKSLIEDLKDHVDSLLEKDIKDWKEQFGNDI